MALPVSVSCIVSSWSLRSESSLWLGPLRHLSLTHHAGGAPAWRNDLIRIKTATRVDDTRWPILARRYPRVSSGSVWRRQGPMIFADSASPGPMRKRAISSTPARARHAQTHQCIYAQQRLCRLGSLDICRYSKFLAPPRSDHSRQLMLGPANPSASAMQKSRTRRLLSPSVHKHNHLTALTRRGTRNGRTWSACGGGSAACW